LDTETQKYYEDYFNMFSTSGWKSFIEEIQTSFDAFRIEDIKDSTQLHKVQGEREQLFRILRFEWGIKSNYDVIMENPNAP
tara:strand:- start:2095 stop:2337 length:243 start_codon:yes stop_codon:yes gene_type:complete